LTCLGMPIAVTHGGGTIDGQGETQVGSATVSVFRYRAGRHVIKLSGAVLSDAVAGLSQLIVAELDRAPALLALDVCSVARVDAAAVDVLVLAAALAREVGVSFCLVGVGGGPVEGALMALGLMDLFDVDEPVGDL
jgi:anti-anti-sigma regulatory factor